MQPSLNSYKLASSEIQVKDLKIASSKQQNSFFPQGNLKVNSNGLFTLKSEQKLCWLSHLVQLENSVWEGRYRQKSHRL